MTIPAPRLHREDDMSNIADQLAIVITAEGEQAKRNLAEVEKAIEGVEKAGDGAATSNGRMADSNRSVAQSGQMTIRSLVGMAARYLTLGSAAAAVYATIRQGLSDAEDERLGLIRLQSVLESTGRTYEVTAGRIDAAAQVLEDDMNLDKQAVMDAMATVATYEGVASDLFERIMKSSADMSYTFGSDIGSAIRDLGRVMEDPIQGLTRLRRQGIMVSREIEDQVSSLVEQNRLYDAQVLILDEIDAKVGGVAERMAEAAGAQSVSAMWGKFVGEIGNTLTGGLLPVQKAVADMLNGATGYMEFRNQIRNIRSEIENLSLEDALALDTGDLQDLLDGLERISSMDDTAYGTQANTILHQLQREIAASGLVEALQEELDLRASLADAEAAQARADEEAAKAAAERAAMIDEEMAATEDLAAIYAATKEGQTASLEAQIASMEEARREDEEALAQMLSSGDVDAEVKAILDQRLSMYDAALEYLREELEDLTVVPEVDTRTVAEKVLGMSASEYVLDIPVSLDLDGRTGIEEVEEQLSSLHDAIVRLNDQKPVEEDALEQWKEDMDILVCRYDELSTAHAEMAHQDELRAIAERELATLMSDEERQAQDIRDYQQQLNELLDSELITQWQYEHLLENRRIELGLITDEEELQKKAKEEILKLANEEEQAQRQLRDYQQELNTLYEAKLITQQQYNDLLEKEAVSLGLRQDASALSAQAEKELLKLMPEEEQAQRQLRDYQQELNTLYEAKLITQQQFNELLEKERELLGLSADQMSDWESTCNIVEDMFSRLLDSTLSYDTIASNVGDTLSAIGDAWASGKDASDAAVDSFGRFAQQLASQASQMFISAGLRCIIEGGWSGLGVGLGLLAAGGLSGIASGAFGGSGTAVSDSIMSAMEDQIAAMQNEAQVRQDLADSINASIDTEYELLKRQLERNLIGEEEFRDQAGNLQSNREEAQHQVDVANARTAMGNAIYSRIQALDIEYQGMSWWDKLWSTRDENIERDISSLRYYLEMVEKATEDELRNLMNTLRDLGVSTGSIPAFAEGGEFITSGRQLILVGDNASGREHVKIEPLDGTRFESAATPSNIIYLMGDVYGIEDLYGKLKSAGLRLERRMRI